MEQDQTRMRQMLERQKLASRKEGPASAKTRREWINSAIALLVDNKHELIEAMCEDFGHRSLDQSLMTDIYASVESLKFARDHVGRWMRPERRTPLFPLGWLGAKAEVVPQPKGVVGLISPWNFPVNLTFSPLASIFAAGNRVMIKPSELTPVTSRRMGELIHAAFDPEVAVVVEGGPDIGQAFSQLAFDHLMFTGSTAVGRHVMRAAADNLVPVTLELGGKCPVIIGKGANIRQAAQRIVTGKLLNAGQVCLSPDYLLVPEERVDEIVEAIRQAVAEQYPAFRDNPDYTSVQNDRHFDRLVSHLEDAVAKGARVIEVNPSDDGFADQPYRKMPLMLILEPTPEMTIMQSELFGPILPILAVPSTEAAIGYVNAHDRPLALYYFGKSSQERQDVLRRTTSGGVTVNDVVMHVSMEDLPFGGIGASGMGRYHGKDGFVEFSHHKAVFKQAWFDASSLFRPPYTEKIRTFMRMMIKK